MKFEDSQDAKASLKSFITLRVVMHRALRCLANTNSLFPGMALCIDSVEKKYPLLFCRSVLKLPHPRATQTSCEVRQKGKDLEDACIKSTLGALSNSVVSSNPLQLASTERLWEIY